MSASPTPSRAAVEQLVRQAVYARLRPAGGRGEAPNPLRVSVSARHCHVTEEALDALFGKDKVKR